MSDGDERHWQGLDRQRTLDAATVLIAFGPDAGAKALHHAFASEWDGDSTTAQFWIEVYRVILERRPSSPG